MLEMRKLVQRQKALDSTVHLYTLEEPPSLGNIIPFPLSHKGSSIFHLSNSLYRDLARFSKSGITNSCTLESSDNGIKRRKANQELLSAIRSHKVRIHTQLFAQIILEARVDDIRYRIYANEET